MQNVLIIFNWCLCDFLVLKHIKVIYWCWHIFVWKMFQNFNITFDYLLMLTYFSCAKCSYHSRLMFMWFSCTETYQLIVWTSSSLVIYWCWHILCGKCSRISILYFWLFSDVDIFFMCKMFLSFRLMFMWFSCT